MLQNSKKSPKQEEPNDFNENEIVNQNQNLFGVMYCKLVHTVELGELIIQHSRCQPKCYDLFKYETICLREIQISKQSPLKQLTQDEAIQQNNSILESRMQKKTKKIKKQKNIIQQRVIIKKNAYLIRKLSQLGMTTENMSALLGLPTSSLYYRKKQIPNSRALKTQFYFTQEQIDWLQNYIKDSETSELWNAQQIFSRFKIQFNLNQNDLSLSYFKKHLKENNIKYKKVGIRGERYFNEDLKSMLQKYCITLLTYINQDYETLYLDETTFSHQQKHPSCWQLQGNKKFRRSVNLRKNLSVIGCIGSNGFQCHQICLGNVNQCVFGQFLEKLVQEANNYYNYRKYLIILDNSPIHQSLLIRNKYLNKLNYLFLPPYSPQLNPIEHIWKLLKDYVKKNQPYDENKILRLIHCFLKKKNYGVIQNLIMHIQVEIKDILQSQGQQIQTTSQN